MSDPKQSIPAPSSGAFQKVSPTDDGSLEALIAYTAGVGPNETAVADRRAAGDKEWIVTP